MNIYFVLEHVSGQGGVETVVTSVARELYSLGHRVIVFLPDASDNPVWEQLLPEVHYFFQPKVNISNRFELIAEKARSFSATLANFAKPDILVGTHVPHTTLYARMATGYVNLPKIPVVSWLHNPPRLFKDPHFINYADVHWAISTGILDEIKSFIKPSPHIYWVGNPIAISDQRIHASNQPQYLVMSRLENQQKRLDILFNALAKHPSPWQLHVFGKGPDEDMLKSVAIQLGINEKIIWEGWVERPWDNIKTATALVLTSDFEGMPMNIGEAFARGVPVISSDCHSGPRDLIKHGVNGFLFPPGDIDSLMQSFRRIESLSDKEWAILSTNALETSLKFDIHYILQRFKLSLLDFIHEERWNF